MLYVAKFSRRKTWLILCELYFIHRYFTKLNPTNYFISVVDKNFTVATYQHGAAEMIQLLKGSLICQIR